MNLAVQLISFLEIGVILLLQKGSETALGGCEQSLRIRKGLQKGYGNCTGGLIEQADSLWVDLVYDSRTISTSFLRSKQSRSKRR